MDGFQSSSWTTGRISSNPTRSLYLLAQSTRYWPGAPLAQAQVLQWMFFEQHSHEPNIATVRFWLSVRKPEPTPFNTELLQQKQALGRAAVLSHGASSSGPPRISSTSVTPLPISRVRLYARRGEGGFDLTPYPAVNAWLDRVRREPRYVTIDEWKA